MPSTDTTPFLLLMPSYNQSQYIIEAVHSILAQDDPHWELWIVDNSTDNTPQIMRQFSDDRIHFHHMLDRMDPGACLNWMLEKARGRFFSYVHTDNNLRRNYVRRMREALNSNPLSLAYCDMRVIDEKGKALYLFRRGKFDFARLLSTDTLGVPFAATTELARAVGGFSENDVTEDIRFCVSTWGIAQFTYVPDLLLDYRLHQNSRTSQSGGSTVINKSLPELMVRIEPGLQRRGHNPAGTLAASIRQSFDELDFLVEDIWLRKLHAYSQPWWRGDPKFDHFVFAGVVSPSGTRNQLALKATGNNVTRSHEFHSRPGALTRTQLRRYLRRIEPEVDRITRRLQHMLPTWALLSAGGQTNMTFRVSKVCFRTCWSALQIQSHLNWSPVADRNVISMLPHLNWRMSDGTEMLLDCEEDVVLNKPAPAILKN